jgi:hypothetical protein
MDNMRISPRSLPLLQPIPRPRTLSGSGGSNSDSFSISPRVEITLADSPVAGLDDFKRELQIATQCQDKPKIDVNKMDKKLDEALELKSNGKLDEARAIYSEIVIECQENKVYNLKNFILREAVWGLLTHSPPDKSRDILLAAASRPDRVVAQYQLGLTHFEGANKDELVGCNLLINAADNNYAPALTTLVDLANKGSTQANDCLLELVYKRSQLAPQIIEKQLNIDIKDEYLKRQLMQAIAEGEEGNKFAIQLIEEHALKQKLFALYFFAEQEGKGKEYVVNEKTKEEVTHALEFLKESGDSEGDVSNETKENCTIS